MTGRYADESLARYPNASGNRRLRALIGEERSRWRSPSDHDGHRFESPQLHQEVGGNRPGFPAPTIPRLFSALARKLMVCGGLFCWDDGPWPANAEMSLRRRILGSRLRGWTDQRDREPFGFIISVRREPPTICQATPLEGPSGA